MSMVAAQQALDHAVVVGRGEQLGRNAQQVLGLGAQALVGAQTVLGVFAAQDADAEFGDFFSNGSGPFRAIMLTAASAATFGNEFHLGHSPEFSIR
jgi:methenyltetrahydromethanopterin cyclohydrolase